VARPRAACSLLPSGRETTREPLPWRRVSRLNWVGECEEAKHKSRPNCKTNTRGWVKCRVRRTIDICPWKFRFFSWSFLSFRLYLSPRAIFNQNYSFCYWYSEIHYVYRGFLAEVTLALPYANIATSKLDSYMWILSLGFLYVDFVTAWNWSIDLKYSFHHVFPKNAIQFLFVIVLLDKNRIIFSRMPRYQEDGVGCNIATQNLSDYSLIPGVPSVFCYVLTFISLRLSHENGCSRRPHALLSIPYNSRINDDFFQFLASPSCFSIHEWFSGDWIKISIVNWKLL